MDYLRYHLGVYSPWNYEQNHEKHQSG